MLCHYAECGILFTIMVSVVMLNVVMLSGGVPTKVLHSFDQYYKTFTVIIYKCSLYARAFALGKPFQPSSTIASKARVYQREAPFALLSRVGS